MLGQSREIKTTYIWKVFLIQRTQNLQKVKPPNVIDKIAYLYRKKIAYKKWKMIVYFLLPI
jgi:hypothetical protein